jgi:hypothetical protein
MSGLLLGLDGLAVGEYDLRMWSSLVLIEKLVVCGVTF